MPEASRLDALTLSGESFGEGLAIGLAARTNNNLGGIRSLSLRHHLADDVFSPGDEGVRRVAADPALRRFGAWPAGVPLRRRRRPVAG
jgi:hypothetical protein